ncbi:MAG: hypothetical protein KC910_20615 [Candidatus Eremiobacteraeota bacterium]|nr:hypothetical protein [Candidatus Eremiobacteraeota bacterium]
MSRRTFYGKVRSIQTFLKDGAVLRRVFVSTGHPRATADATLEILEPEGLAAEFLAELKRAQNHGFSVSVTLEGAQIVDLHVD